MSVGRLCCAREAGEYPYNAGRSRIRLARLRVQAPTRMRLKPTATAESGLLAAAANGPIHTPSVTAPAPNAGSSGLYGGRSNCKKRNLPSRHRAEN